MVKIIWSSKAVSDKKSIFEYWTSRNKSPSYSIKLNQLFELKLQQISDNPFSGITTEMENIRAILVEDYYLYYSLNADQIRILRIWDARQNSEIFEP
ncbi:hypothetical protein CBW16_11255 [Flavobacteriaceae bacterium JJC]|nr:hypothetical protein CBW16_11255 [Flavobacteriaceae bacterium JJC]